MFLTESGCRQRHERLFGRIAADWALITSPAGLSYFAAFWPSPFVFHTQEARAALLLGRDGSAVLFADNVQETFARTAFTTAVELPLWYRCIEAAAHRGELLCRSVLERMRSLGSQMVAIENSSCPAAIAETLSKKLNIDETIRALRRSKDADEIEQIVESLRIATIGLQAAREKLRPGLTELQAYNLICEACCEAAEGAVLIYGDVVSGPRCGQIGGAPGLRRIEAGDLVLLDFSAIVQGYRGDFASTFVCGGRPTVEQRQWFAACLAAMEAGEARLAAGTPAQDVYAAVRGVLVERGLEQFFPHHAGHGVGLGHPEPPFLTPGSDEILAMGDVLTLEPGLYSTGHGGMRIERNYVVTERGARTLTTHPLSLD